MSAAHYPGAATWYRRLDLEHGVTRFWEPHVHPLEQANFFHDTYLTRWGMPLHAT